MNVSAFIDAWVPHGWFTGLQTGRLPEYASFIVETENSRYELTVLCARTGDVLVRGGRLFTEETAARLTGSSIGGRLLEVRGVYIGFRMQLHTREHAVITSRVRSIRVRSTRDDTCSHDAPLSDPAAE